MFSKELNGKSQITGVLTLLMCLASFGFSAEILIEAESFNHTFDDTGDNYKGLVYGGWVLDQQFMDQMGSPYLLAHGLGTPVADANTVVTFPVNGTYKVWVRTRDWTGWWKEPHFTDTSSPKYSAGTSPGRFEVLINNVALTPATPFGTQSADWHWQDGGTVTISNPTDVEIRLHDLTGYEGRCDAIFFTTEMGFVPPDTDPAMKTWRQNLLDTAEVTTAGPYDLVVVGGGIAGMSASVSAARLGLTVALIQDRPVLAGNNSSEVRVWLNGNTHYEPYPHVGDITREFEQSQRAHYGPSNTAVIYEDFNKLAILQAEPTLSLFLNHRGNEVVMDANSIVAVIAENTQTGQRMRFDASWFVDSTGDGCIGYLAGADYEMYLYDGLNDTHVHMGRCNLWNVKNIGVATVFPNCPWALDLDGRPFPGSGTEDYTKLGGWYWESGMKHNPFEKNEYIRDWNFRAMYGAWDSLKNSQGLYATSKLNWSGYISGKRESRRLLGDIILDDDDFFDWVAYQDGCVPTSWGRDLHWPHSSYKAGFEGDEFITTYSSPGYTVPYWIPYRCLYSRNINNLFMAGRDISVTHWALGPVRVMRTCGMMGEIVGMAAAVCKELNTTPRGVYTDYLPYLFAHMNKNYPPDFVPPDDPTNLTAQGSDDSVLLNWDDNSESDLARYNVYRSGTHGGPYVQIGSANTSAYDDMDVINGQTYYYVVTSQDQYTNESGHSNEANARPRIFFSVIGPNFALSATAIASSEYNGTYVVENINDGSADITDNNTRWLSADGVPNWVELTFATARYISACRVISGYYSNGSTTAPIEDFVLQYHNGSTWVDISQTQMIGNVSIKRTAVFPATQSNRFRLYVTKTKENISRVFELELYHPQMDLDGDGTVTSGDLAAFGAQWLNIDSGWSADFDANDRVDMADFSLLAEFWGW